MCEVERQVGVSGRETSVYMYLCPLCFWICVDSTVNAFGHFLEEKRVCVHGSFGYSRCTVNRFVFFR